MDIRINKKFPLGIKEQLKRQIKTMIEDGRLSDGEMLLSARDMGIFLNINRNTVASVYRELDRNGFVDVIKGSGTFVRKVNSPPKQNQLREIFCLAYDHAVQSGFSGQDITNYFITGLLEKSGSVRKAAKVILIDCNYDVLKTLDKKIKIQCDMESHFMLIQDIEKFPGKFVKRAKEYDLILCGMSHLEELKTAVPELPVETIGFPVDPDIDQKNLDFIVSKLEKRI